MDGDQVDTQKIMQINMFQASSHDNDLHPELTPSDDLRVDNKKLSVPPFHQGDITALVPNPGHMVLISEHQHMSKNPSTEEATFVRPSPNQKTFSLPKGKQLVKQSEDHPIDLQKRSISTVDFEKHRPSSELQQVIVLKAPLKASQKLMNNEIFF